ncbi:MAG: hypothetical protein ABFD89_11560 [Bryobacteraceae bacterium]
MGDPIAPNAVTGEVTAPAEANGVIQELANVKAELEKVMKQSQGQSAVIRKLTDQVETLSKPKEAAADEKPKGPLATKLAEMEARLREGEARTARARMTGLMRSVESQLTSAGVRPGLAKLATESIVGRVKDHVSFDDSETAVLKLGEETVTIEDHVATFLSTDDGKELLPEKDKPKLAGLVKGSVSSAGKLRVTQADLTSGRFKLEDVMAGRVILTDG